MSEHSIQNHHQSCRQILSEFSTYLDGELQQSLCMELEKHLQECENCRIVFNTLRKTIELYREQGETPCLPDDVRSRLFYKLDLSDL